MFLTTFKIVIYNVCRWHTNDHIPYHRILISSDFNSVTSASFYYNPGRKLIWCFDDPTPLSYEGFGFT